MSRVALLLALLLLAACGTTSTATTGSSETASPPGSSTPASSEASDTATPPGVWTGATAAAQFDEITRAFFAAKDPSVDAFNAFGAGDLPSDAAFPSAWAPVAKACATAEQASATAAHALVADHQAGHWSAAAWAALQKSLKEIQWWGRTQKACAAITTKPELLAWTMRMDIPRSTAISSVFDRTRGVLINS